MNKVRLLARKSAAWLTHATGKTSSHFSGLKQFARSGMVALFGFALMFGGIDFTESAEIELLDEKSHTILGGYKDKAAGAADSATLVPDNFTFKGGTLDLTGGYYRATGRLTVGEDGYGKITGGSSANLPTYSPSIPFLNRAPDKSGALFLLYNPRLAGSQLVLGKNATLEIAFSYEGWNYVAVTNNGNYDYQYTPVVFGENSHIKLTGGTFRFDPYRHDRDVKLSNFIFNGGWLATRGGDDVITADEEGQAVGKIEMGMGSDTFIVPEGINITGLRLNGQLVSEIRMYEFATTGDKGTGGLSGNMAEGTGLDPSDTVEIRAGASSTDITYNFGYYNDLMTLGTGARLIGGTVDMGNGPDTFSAPHATLDGANIKLGDGADTLNLDDTTLANNIAFDLGLGNDTANVRDMNLTLGNHATIKLGAGDDVANLTNVTIDGSRTADSFAFDAGNDTLNLTDVQVGKARIAMNAGSNTVNVRAGTTRIDDSLEFSRSGTTANLLYIENGGELRLDDATLKFAGKVLVDTGGTLSGSGTSESTDGVTLRGTLLVGNGTDDGDLTLTDSNGVTAEAGATITGGGVLSATRIKLQGMVDFVVEAGRKLIYDDLLSDFGSLRKQEGGTLELGGANDYTGGTQVEAGTLVLKHADAAGTGALAVSSGATATLAFSGQQDAYDAVFDNVLSGPGEVRVAGHDIDISADNSFFSGQLNVLADGSAQVRSGEHLGSAGVVLDGTLKVAPLTGGFSFDNVLSGSGTLLAQMGSGSDRFDFDAAAGQAFQGTLGMGRGTFELEGVNTAALQQATLRMDQGSTVHIGQGVQEVGGFAFNGGTAVFATPVPDATQATGSVKADVLDASGTGTVQVDLPAPYVPSVPGTVGTATLLEQDDGNIGIRLVAADQVIGSGGALELRDLSGQLISDRQQVNIAQGGDIVAIGEYDFGLTTATGDGLHVNYGLRRVDIQQDQTLELQQAPAATGAAADLAAKVTGSGNLAIDAGTGTISLSNATNDYTGTTSVLHGGLRLAADHALGNTAALNLAGSTSAAFGGYEQRIGALHAEADSLLDLQGGQLDIGNGGYADGELTGAGSLHLDGGTLDITGANSGLSANTRIAQNATAHLTQASGLGSGAIATDGTLSLDGAVGELRNAISGSGAVNLKGDADIEASGNNSNFSGQFGLENGTRLSISLAQNLGTAAVGNDGTLRIDSAHDWSLGNTITGDGALVKEGQGLIDVAGDVSHGGRTRIEAGGLLVGEGKTLGRAGADEVSVAAGALLAGLGTVSGHVENLGTVSLLNGLAGHYSPTPGTFVLANGLRNAGTLSLAGADDSQAGNILLVKGGYVGDGGVMIVRTEMGDDASATDKLVVDGGAATGNTGVLVKNAGGNGAQTNQGIRLVETRNGGTTEAGAFSLDAGSDGYRQGADSLAAGAFDYRLVRGGNGGVADDWYLVSARNGSSPDSDTAVPFDPPYRPEVGAYMSNRQAALAMPVHTLHERQGQAPGMIGKDLEESSDAAVWMRVLGDRTQRDGAGGQDIRTRGEQVHLGSDLLRFSDGDDGSVRLGVMGSWGTTRSNSDNGTVEADARVSGYNVGVYGTWYGNQDILSGPYLDGWLMHGAYNNRVKGEGLLAENYRSETFTSSLEGGYSFNVHDSGDKQVFVEPQAQAIAQRYTAQSHTEHTGTRVTGLSDSGVTTRLGVRVHANLKEAESKSVLRPFAEVNWWHGPSDQTMTFSSDRVRESLPGDRFEVKVGVQGSLSEHTSVWGSLATEHGSENFQGNELQLGIKYSW